MLRSSLQPCHHLAEEAGIPPAAHADRLIASCTLTAAAWGRLPESVLPGFWFYGGVDVLIMMGAARDLLVNRKTHPVYLTALPLFIAGQIAISQITSTEWWSRFAHSILF